jgi:cytochrome c2
LGGAELRTAAWNWLKSAWRWAAHRPLLTGVLVLLFALAEISAVAAGVFAERHGWPEKAWHRLQVMVEQRGSVQTVQWREAIFNQHTLEWASVRIGPPQRGGGVAEVDGAVVFSTPHGRLSYLSRDNTLTSLNLRVPMDYERLRASPLMEDPLFEAIGVRVHDLFTRETAQGQWELYATFSRYVRENCFQFVMSRVMLEARDDAIRPASDWEELYIARPGCIRYKDRSWRFVGEQAGGRMEMLDDRTMLITIGDHQFDGFNDAHNAPMDPEWDLGKIIAFDLQTRRAHVYASGMRNPQGLAIMRDGRIVQTEHGPQGGDEINIIHEGANYGWPLVTYGMNYGYPRRVWPTDPSPGGHGGYERPAIAFVPSIAIANLVQPDAREFPLWADNDLLLGAMRARTLYHVRLNGDRVAYAEPLPFGDERLRDIISMRDGRIVILTDSGHLILMRNADLHGDEPRAFTVAGLNTLPQDETLPEDVSPVARGRYMFASACAQCHGIDGEIGIGPPLNGVVGRRIGSVEGYGYSQALSGQDRVWTEDLIVAFATDPQHRFPGTTMPQTTLSWTQLPFIVQYLETTRYRGVRTPSPEEEQ